MIGEPLSAGALQLAFSRAGLDASDVTVGAAGVSGTAGVMLVTARSVKLATALPLASASLSSAPMVSGLA